MLNPGPILIICLEEESQGGVAAALIGAGCRGSPVRITERLEACWNGRILELSCAALGRGTETFETS